MSIEFSSLWSDLRRRHVFRAAAIYVALSWVVVQVADVVGPAVNLPDRGMTILVGIAIVGFPITIILAWLFDLTPQGVRRTRPGSATGILAIVISLGLLAAGTAGFVWLIKPGDDAIPASAYKEILADSIAVLPFRDLSANGNSQPFADGIAQVLIHRLATINTIKVVASDSTFLYRDNVADFENIGRLLGVERVLAGTVQRAGDNLRISTQLIDSRTGESVWTELFDRKSQDIFAIQDEIALAVADNLDAEVSTAARKRATHVITDNLDAYDLYLLALHSLNTTPIDDGYLETIDLLEQSLRLDPDLAPAWAALAHASFWTSTRGYIPWEEGVSNSRQYLARARELDPELSDAYALQIQISISVDEDFEAAHRSYEKAIEYGPSNLRAYLYFGNALFRIGRYEDAVSKWSEALKLNPVSPITWLRTNLGRTYFLLGEYDLGMQQFAANAEQGRGTKQEGALLDQFGNAALGIGRIDEAAAAYEISIDKGFSSTTNRAMLAISLLKLRDIDKAKVELERAEAMIDAEVAQGRSMNIRFLSAESARMRLDIATDNLEGLLLSAKHFTQIADSDDDSQNASNAPIDASMRWLALRRYDEVARLMSEFVKVAPDAENYAYAVFANEKIGNADMAEQFRKDGRALIEEQLDDHATNLDRPIWFALFEAAVGENNQAIEYLQQAYAGGYLDLSFLIYMPLFDQIRSDPRFVALLEAMLTDTDAMRARVDAARESGDWESLIAKYFEDQDTLDRREQP